MPSTTATKTTARQLNVGDMVSKTKSGEFAKIASLSPGANSVWITFEKGNRIRPGFDTAMWVLAETTETPAPAAEAPKATPATPTAVEPVGGATFAAYLEARTSGAANAPHLGLPFITEKGILRVKPSDWLEYLAAKGIEAPKRTALQALRDEGLVQRVYPLPAVDGQEALAGKSFGLYTGKATPAMASLPRRQAALSTAAKDKAIAQVASELESNPALAAVAAAGPSDDGLAKVEARTLAVGDVIGTTRTDSKKAIANGEGTAIVIITTSPDGRVQARDDDGKVIRSLAPDTKVWRSRNA